MEKFSDQKSTVLYVDDIKANLMLFDVSFEDTYNIILAESGKEALQILKEQEVHVIVSDQSMPGMTGNELLEIVTSKYPDIMRFMITAYTDYETVVEAINKGHLYGFFNKPYNLEDVKHSINNALEVRSLRIKNREMIVKLEKANELMVGLDRSKTKFLTSITEEIRTPINKVMTAVHMIKDKIDSNELSELLDVLDVSVRRLEGFSDAAKYLTKLQGQDFKLNGNAVSLNEILEVGIIEKGNALNNEELTISIDSSSISHSVAGDYDMLQATFTSILGIVIDHTKKGSEIKLGIYSAPDGVSIKIMSEGSFYTEQEKEDLKTLIDKTKSIAEKDFRLELVLANEILAAHLGKLIFAEEGKTCGFSMLFHS